MDTAAPVKIKYTCPMHPDVIREAPGDCPKCGMSLEAMAGEPTENTELISMTKRFWIALIFTIPVFLMAMITLPLNPALQQWIEMILATPVALWCGSIFYVRAWTSLITRHLN